MDPVATSQDKTTSSRWRSFRTFLGELRRRKVWETMVAYAAVVFVLLQLGEIVFPAFSAPDWALPLLVRCCFLGLPLVLALAWLFDITSDGIEKTEYETATETAPAASTGAGHPLLPRLALVAVTLATVGGLGWLTVKDSLATEAPADPAASSPAGLASASRETGTENAEELPVRSLAVLPLDDFSEVEGGAYFTAGLHEELISQLSRLGSARVVSRTSVVQYDRTGKTMPAIARDLGVEGVVEGSVYRTGDRVRITVQLIHGPSDRHLWANSYEGTTEDAIALQGEVARAIAREIQAELFPDDVPSVPESRVAANPQAQEAYLKGRYAQAKASVSPTELEEAVEHYRAALRHDSGFAPAYAGLAASRLLLSLEAGDSAGKALVVDSGVTEPLRKALALDESSPEARAVLLSLTALPGVVAGRFPSPGGELPESGQPGDSESLEAELSMAATEFGRQLQRSLHERAWSGPPRDSSDGHPGYMGAVLRLRMAGNLRESEEILRKVVDGRPGEMDAWRALESLKAGEGDIAGAVEVHRRCVEVNGDSPEARASLDRLEELYGAQGERGYWIWRLSQLQELRARGGKVSSVDLARAQLALGQTERALELLAEAAESRDRQLLTVWTDPAWDTLRTDPRFREILARIRKGRP